MFYDFLKNITLRLAKFDDFTEFNTQKYIPDRQQCPIFENRKNMLYHSSLPVIHIQ